MEEAEGREEAETAARTDLTGAEKRRLRGRAQLLEPAVCVGKNGVSAGTLAAVGAALRKADLAKVRFATVSREEMKAQIAEIERGTDTVCVGSVGRTAAFFNPNFVPEAKTGA